jgi:DNA polymerase-3 subunit beta
MKIRVQRAPFLRGCQLAGRALPGRAADAALASLLLHARGDTCALHALGADVGLRLEVPCVVEEAGEALLPARSALAVVREAAEGELTLESAPGRLRARGQGAEFVLEAPAAARPALMVPFPGGACHLTPPDLLGRAVRRTLYAAGRCSARYSLHAVLWEVEPDQVRLVTTDGLRLAVAEVPAQAQDDSQALARWLLPARAVDLLARLAEGEAQPVEALFAQRHAYFRVGPATLCARYVEGEFPDWRRAAPPRPRHLLAVPVGPFLAGVRQAAALRGRGGARLRLRFEPGWALLEGRQAGAGQARVRLPLPLAGGRVEVVLDARPLVELLRAFDPADTLLLGLTDPDTAAVFSDGDSYTHVLMPLRPG